MIFVFLRCDSKDAVVLLSKAAEEFTKWLGQEAESVATVNNR